jgi:hypothetical protein
MAGFLNEFLHAEIAGLTRKDPPRAYLAAFGKHPGWNDHIEDIGLDTRTLIDAKRYLYLQGLSGQIDLNAWEKLDTDSRLEGFDHWLLWHRPGECLVGRLWSSSDGKGRTRYPMILLAQIVGAPLLLVLRDVLPLLDTLSRQCREVTTAAEVQRIITAGVSTLRTTVSRLDQGGDSSSLINESMNGAMEAEGLARIFHAVVNQLSPYAPGTINVKAENAPKGRHLRLPRLGGGTEASLAGWTAFLMTQLDWSVPILSLLPVSERWIDVIVGEPAAADFFCLKANAKSLPLTQDVPYQITPALEQAVAELYDGGMGSGLPARGIFSRKATGDNVRAVLSQREALWTAAGEGLFKKFRSLLGG